MARRSVCCLFGYSKQVNVTLRLSREYIYGRNYFENIFQFKCLSYFMPIKSSNTAHNYLAEAIYSRTQSSTSVLENSPKHPSGCPICSRDLTFTYKNVLLLSQFVSPEGNILNRRITGVCRKQQRKLEKAIEISRRLGLIPRKPPALMQQDKNI